MFYELKRPGLEALGVGAGKWFVLSPGFGNYLECGALYADGRCGNMLGAISTGHNGDNSMYYFESEADAHACACKYYESHRLPYPFYADWHALLSPTQGVSREVESEVMEF